MSITFNAPLFGFFLCIFATLLLKMDFASSPVLYQILRWTQMANLFWAIVNLLPVLPLDGGQLLRIVLEAMFGLRGFKASLIVGAVIAFLLSFFFFIRQQFLIGAIFFLFGFQSFDSWRKSRIANVKDRDEENRLLMIQGEAVLKAGKKQEAKQLFDEIRKKTEGGVLACAASQYLAFLDEEEGKHKEAYDLLVPIKQHLAEDALCLLHKLAAGQKDYSLVAELSSECYAASPTLDAALRNARAFAFLKQAKPAGGWLQTAWQHGGINLDALLCEEEFTVLKNDPEFRGFVDNLQH